MMEMSANKRDGRTFSVAALGFSRLECQVLSRVFDVTQCRNRMYDLLDEKNADFHLIDIALVKISDQNDVSYWQRYRLLHPELSRHPVVCVSRKKELCLDGGNYHVSMPLNPSRVLKELDRFTVKELDYLPELKIGENSVAVNNKIAQQHINESLESARQSETFADILVVDDSLTVRKQLAIELQMRHCNATLVPSGEKALEAIAEKNFDAVFLDVVMPGIDGYAVCKRIRRSAINRSTPVIMLTSRSSPFDRVKGTLAGCSAYLTKPINHTDFSHVIERHLHN